MEKKIYFIECTCIKDCSYPNVDFHVGDVLYFNKKASSNEMYLFYSYRDKRHRTDEETKHIESTFGKYIDHLPFTRLKKNAKKWEIKRYPEWEARIINDMGEFKAEVKEIKVTYTEEEV